MKLYKYKDEKGERYYTNLTKLCKHEALSYFNVYHAIKRLKTGIWNNKEYTQSVKLLHFSPSEN